MQRKVVPVQLSRNTIQSQITRCYDVRAGTDCLHNMVVRLGSRLRSILHNLQYRLHTVQYFAQTKILCNNINRLGATVKILCNQHCAKILNV